MQSLSAAARRIKQAARKGDRPCEATETATHEDMIGQMLFVPVRPTSNPRNQPTTH